MTVGDRGGLWGLVVALAARQQGVISYAQLIAIGFSNSGIHNAVAAGRLHRLYRGVYALGRPDLAPNGYRLAAVLACGEGAALSYAAAAAFRGIRQSAAAKIDVTIPRRSALRHRGIRIHNHPDLTPADVEVVDGMPVASVSRTLLDLATFLREPQLERACDQAAVMRIFDMKEMSELLRRSHGRRGVRRLRNVLARGDLGENVPASGLERRYRNLCAREGVPKPDVNRYILLGDEYHKVDFLWRKERVVIETDGGPYHSTGWQRRRDAQRDALLDEYGWAHARIPDDEVEQAPLRAVETARRLLAGRSDHREA